MSLKPILFSTEMVRALLEGRKIVTRRVVKPQPAGKLFPMEKESCWPGYWPEAGSAKVVKPPYQTGDVLWVRETWAKNPFGEGYIYPTEVAGAGQKWRPSIHMPREAARIFLRVTGVRVERLQELTLKDAKMEGMDLRGPMFVDFVKVWNNTVQRHPNKFKRYPYYWEDNPWVWVIEFERIQKEEAEHAKPE